MSKILGLDLGTNSIGWAVVEKEKAKLEEMSSASSKLNEQMEAIQNM